jgi:predicted MFS family arabinose efflux permease
LLGWRSAFLIAGILGAAGVLIAWAALPRGDSGGEEESQPLLDFRPVLANRDVLALIVGYAAAIWGCVGLRQWIVVFLTFCAGNQSTDPAQAWIILGVGATINFLGVPVGLIGNELSIRYGLRTIATLVFVLSAFAGGLFGFTAMLPYIAVLGLSVVAGFIVQDNFSNLTSGVLAVAGPRYRGATIGLYSCIGFGAGFLGTLLFGVTLDQFGGTSQLAAWALSFLHLRAGLSDWRGRHRVSLPRHLPAVTILLTDQRGGDRRSFARHLTIVSRPIYPQLRRQQSLDLLGEHMLLVVRGARIIARLAVVAGFAFGFIRLVELVDGLR